MNILEAFEKSDIIKKKGEEDKAYMLEKGDPCGYRLFVEDILATDWEPVIEPLTFDRIKREAVAGKTLLVSPWGKKYLYMGFNRRGQILMDKPDDYGFCTWDTELTKWQISKEKWRG